MVLSQGRDVPFRGGISGRDGPENSFVYSRLSVYIVRDR